MWIAWFGKSCVYAFLSEGHRSDPLQGSQAIFRERLELHFLAGWGWGVGCGVGNLPFFIENASEGLGVG